MAAYQFNQALAVLWRELSRVDEALAEKKPWEMESASEKKRVLEPVSQQILNVAIELQPFLPQTAASVIAQFSEQQVKKAAALFPRKNLLQ